MQVQNALQQLVSKVALGKNQLLAKPSHQVNNPNVFLELGALGILVAGDDLL